VSKYKLEDLKVGAVFKESGGSGTIIRTIIAVGETNVFYSYPTASNRAEGACSIGGFLNGNRGELVKPTTKVAYIEYCRQDLMSKHYCPKEVWDMGGKNDSNLKFMKEFEMEFNADGFPIEEAL